MKEKDFFKKMHTGYVNGKNPLLSREMDNRYDRLAKQMGLERGSYEWCRFLWVDMLGVSPEVFDSKINQGVR